MQNKGKLSLLLAFAICRRPSVSLSSVCNVRAPYSGDWNFRQFFTPFGTSDIYWHQGHSRSPNLVPIESSYATSN